MQNECDTCGACCSYYAHFTYGLPLFDEPRERIEQMREEGGAKWIEGPLYEDVSPDNYMVVEGVRYLPVLNVVPFESTDLKVCHYFAGEPGRKGGCKIYKQRPILCSKFIVGGEACNKCREWANLPPIKTNS